MGLMEEKVAFVTGAARGQGCAHALRLGREGADAVSSAVLWLASDQSSEITGLAMPVDAGHMITPGFNPSPA